LVPGPRKASLTRFLIWKCKTNKLFKLMTSTQLEMKVVWGSGGGPMDTALEWNITRAKL
jgi:hypothetical protein